jgi:hypothetical protein
VDANWIQSQAMEAETLADLALHALAVDCASDPNLRARLETQFSVALVNGIGAIPATMLTEYLREGSVKDSDLQANGYGNVLQRVKYFNDLLGYQLPAYGYYCLSDNQIFTKQISSGDLTATIGPLIIDAPFVPAKADINTDIPDEITDDLAEILAVKLRGVISRMPVTK